jgi:hypothetical protein
MTARQWRQVHLIHAAYHLSFLVPEPEAAGVSGEKQAVSCEAEKVP